MTPLLSYQRDLERADFFRDPAQAAVVAQLHSLYLQLLSPRQLSGREIPGRWRLPFTAKHEAKGLYIWGPVGRGKTYLMDSFFHALPEGMAIRQHYHRFMQRVHRQLRDLSGSKNPLQRVARKLREEARVLCFDEFAVDDIGDAMILANLLEALFEQGVTLVATSNIPPDRLYADGLQRGRFLPAIALLKQSTHVVALEGELDYRRRNLAPVNHYFNSASPDSQANLEALFCRLSVSRSSASDPEVAEASAVIEYRPLEINGRKISVRKRTCSTVWFLFSALCEGPRSQLDYIEISQRFDVVILSDIPVLGGAVEIRKVAVGTEDSADNSISLIDRSQVLGRTDDAARRFVALVDEFYDRRVQLIISAAAPITQLYVGGHVSFEFRRTVSRLIEMQSEEYLQLNPRRHS